MNSELVLQLLILAVSKAETLGALYSKAKSEGRDVTDDELKSLSGGADASAKALQDWIDSKKVGG
jgi:hypothetical protein